MFTLAQIPVAPLGLLMGSIFVGAPLAIPRHRLAVQPCMIAAWRRGKRAKLLLVADWERLMGMPLVDVQRELKFVSSAVAPKKGIFYWDPKRKLVRRPPENDMQHFDSVNRISSKGWRRQPTEKPSDSFLTGGRRGGRHEIRTHL